MVDRITRLDRRVGIAVVAVMAVVLVGLLYWAFQSLAGGDGEEPVEAAVPAAAEDWMEPLPGVELGPDGTPIPQAELIAPGRRGDHCGDADCNAPAHPGYRGHAPGRAGHEP